MSERYQLPDGRVVEALPGGGYRVVSGGKSNPMNNPLVDPRLQGQTTKANNEAAASNYAQADAAAAVRIKELEAQIKTIEASNAGAMSGTDLQKARLEVDKLNAEIKKLSSGKGSALEALQGQVDRVGELYRTNLQGGLPNTFNKIIPDMVQPGKGVFDTASQGLANPFMAAFKVEGQGSQSDTDLLQFIKANVPEQGDSDGVIEEKIANIQRRINAERGTQPQPQVPPTAELPQEKMEIATTGTRSQIDPALKATGTKVGTMIANGSSKEAIYKFLRDSGVDPASTNVNSALIERAKPSFKQWQRQNPGQPYPIGAEFYTKEVPMSGGRNLFNKAASTDLGGTLTAYGASSANAMLGGNLDSAVGALSGDPAMAQTGMEMLRSQHPAASLVGDITGQGLLEGTLGRIPGARGIMASQWGRRGTDAAYGAYSGAGESNDDRLGGAVSGALTNAGFGMFGRSAQRGVGRTMTGVRNADLRYLDRAGVPLTVGQIGRGSDNIVGRAAGGIEERAMGLPGFDAVIGQARQRGDQGFNAAAFREMGGSGQTGAAGIDEGAGLVRNSFNFLDNASMQLDAPYAGGQAGVRAGLPNLPAFGNEIGTSLNALDSSAVNGALPGRAWQDGIRAARANRSSIAGQPFSGPAVNALGDVEQNLMGLATRQGPPGTIDNLNTANALNARFQTISSALDNGPAQKADELFSAGRLDDASRVNARNFGGRTASLSGNRPFYDLTSAGKAVMPNLTPDSGTAGRLMLIPATTAAAGGAIGYAQGENGAQDAASGGGVGLGTGIALAGLAAAPYSRTGQRAIQRALLGPRSAGMTRIGDRLIANPRWAGMFASGAGRDYVYQDELP